MSQTQWDPFENISSLRREINRLMEDFLEGRAFRSKGRGTHEPSAEVFETSETVVVRLQVPGARREDLHLAVSGDILTVNGEIQDTGQAEKSTVHQQEFRYGAFSRTIVLPAPVQAERATANLRAGVLEITIPKSTPGHSHDIPIQE
jgi:HSP20 family protein